MLSDPHPEAARVLEPFAAGPVAVSRDQRHLRAPVAPLDGGGGLATTVVRALDGAAITVEDVQVRPPSLDDVFFALTGSRAADADVEAADSDAKAPEVDGEPLDSGVIR